MTRSLRTRVMLVAGVVLALALGGSGVALYMLVRGALVTGFDQALAAQVRVLAGMVQVAAPGGELVLQAPGGLEPEAGSLPDLYEITAPGHRGLRHTALLSEAALPVPGGGTLAHPLVIGRSLPDGTSGHLAAARVAIVPATPSDHDGDEGTGGAEPAPRERHREDEEHDKKEEREHARHRHPPAVPGGGQEPPGGVPATPPAPVAVDIVVAQGTAVLDGQLATIGWLLLAVTGGTIIASELLMAWAVRRSLRPLARLADGIAQLGDQDLGQRVALADAPAELAPVVGRLNELLARIEEVLVRERGFSADVSHELRTPLAGLLATIDVCLRKQRDVDSYHRALSTCRRITRQMQGMVGNLLDLTRLESGNLASAREPIDLPSLLRAAWRPYAERATVRQVGVEWEVEPGLVISDAERLGQVLANLFDNAVSYVDEGGAIRIAGRARGGRQVITVANTGSRVAADQAGQVFARFWRADSARHGTQRHCGLGLALSQRLVAVLDGTITARAELGGWFEIEITLATADAESLEEAVTPPAGSTPIAFPAVSE